MPDHRFARGRVSAPFVQRTFPPPSRENDGTRNDAREMPRGSSTPPLDVQGGIQEGLDLQVFLRSVQNDMADETA